MVLVTPMKPETMGDMLPNRPPPLAPTRPEGYAREWALFDSDPAHAVPLIGRATQLQQLRDWLLDAAQLSRLTLWGVAGVGKSRLAHALAQAALADGWQVLRLPQQDCAQEAGADMDCQQHGWLWPLGQPDQIRGLLFILDDLDQYLSSWEKLAHAMETAKQADIFRGNFPVRLLLVGRERVPAGNARSMMRSVELELKPFAKAQLSWDLYAAASTQTGSARRDTRTAWLGWLSANPKAGVPALLLSAAACDKTPALNRLRRAEDWATTLAAQSIARTAAAASEAGLAQRGALLWFALAQLADGFRPGTGPELACCALDSATLGLPDPAAAWQVPALSHSLPSEALRAYVFFQVWAEHLADDAERAALIWAALTPSPFDPARVALRMRRFARFLQHLHTLPPWVEQIAVPPDLRQPLAPHLARFDQDNPPLPACVAQIYDHLFTDWQERTRADPDALLPAPADLHWNRWCATLSFQQGEPWFNRVNRWLEQLTERDPVGYAPDYARLLTATTRMSARYRQWPNAEAVWTVAEKYYLIAVEAGNFELGREWIQALSDLEAYCIDQGAIPHGAVFGERIESAALMLAKFNVVQFGSLAEAQLDARFRSNKGQRGLAQIQSLFERMLELQALRYQAEPGDPERALRYAALLSGSATFATTPAAARAALQQALPLLSDGPKHAELRLQIEHALQDCTPAPD